MKRIWIVENAVPFEQLAYLPPYIENTGVRYLLEEQPNEWTEDSVRVLCNQFCSDEYELAVFQSPGLLERHLRLGVAPPHVVIFDWEGVGFGDAINVDAIGGVLASTFSYVQVYTQYGADAVDGHLAQLRERYPGRLLPTRAKDQVTPAELRASVTEAWENTIAGETADAVRDRARAAVERLLIDLCSVPKTALAAVVKGSGNQFVSVVMAKLRDELGAAPVDELSAIVKGDRAPGGGEDLRRLQSAFYYYFPQDDLVRTGDILVKGDGNYAMVVTPWCNLESFQKKTGGYLTVVDACEITAHGFNGAGVARERIGESATASHGKASYSIVALPNVPKTFGDRKELIDLALITHSWNTVRVNGVEGQLRYGGFGFTRVCTLTETFGGAVVSHLAKTISSLGVPDFPKFEIERLTNLLK
jgi:hypothetical protein